MVVMRLGKYLVGAILAICACACNNEDQRINSPDGKLVVNVQLVSGMPIYTVHFKDTLVLDTSRLGLVMKDQNYGENLMLLSVSEEQNIHEQFSMHQGKRKKCLYEAVARTFHYENDKGARVDIVFQVSNDGVAFRYSFPEQASDLKSIENESTSFHFVEGTTAFLQPMSIAKSGWSQVNPCYEEFYEKEIPAGTPSPSKAGWVYPALFHSGKNWVLITEAALDKNYCATRLMPNSPNREYTVGFPDPAEKFPGGNVNPQSSLPWLTPWRVITIGSLKTIVESDLGVALANKGVEMDTSFIKPGHSSWSWALLKDDSTVYDVQKKFIDYAADMQWNYCLIDAEWDKRIGYDKIKELSQYANTKNIGLILWYNSAGDWNTTPFSPKSKLLTHEDREKEFSLLNELGIKGIKVDFFGGDGQSMIQYYLDILEDAAKHKILVNFHGATIPRGWHRTYPNLMSMEAIKGFEYVTFDQGNADEEPSHCSMLPFTRNAFDPMDFTPLSLDSVPRINRKTTSGFELALSVIFLSGIQHFVETPTGMQHVPSEVKNFLQTLPEQWDDTKFLTGYPGKDCVVARKSNKAWYVAGINSENNAKKFTCDLSFLQGRSGYMIVDTNENKRVPLKRVSIDKVNPSMEIEVAANGGFVLVVE
jgi:alpha-glucosidase